MLRRAIHGVRQGSVVGLQMPNCVELPVAAYLAVARLGAIILTAVPGQFCSGTDLTALHDVEPGTKAEDRVGHTVALTECQLFDDHKEGVAAFLGKRAPVFTGN